MRNGRDITNKGDLHASGRNGAHGSFTAGAGALHIDADSTHAVVLRLAGGRFSGNLRSKGGGLTRTLKAALALRGPGNSIAARIRKSDDGIVERSLNVGNAHRNVLFFLFLDHFLDFCFVNLGQQRR